MYKDAEQKVFEERRNLTELKWLEKNFLIGDGPNLVLVYDVERLFDEREYQGKKGLDRIRSIKAKESRPMNRMEFSMACGKQQLLEILTCLYIIYGEVFPFDALFHIGISQGRLLNSSVGHYYGQWAQLELEEQVAIQGEKAIQSMRDDLMRLQLKVEDDRKTRQILDECRERFTLAKMVPHESTRPTSEVPLPVFVLEHVGEGLNGKPMVFSKQLLSEFNAEGCEHVVPVQYDEVKISKLLGDSVLVVDDYQQMVWASCIGKNSRKVKDKLIGQFEQRVPLPGGRHQFIEDLGRCELPAYMPDLEQMGLLKTLEELEKQNKEMSLIMMVGDAEKTSIGNHFQMNIDLHTLYPDRGQNVILGVTWAGNCMDRLSRVVVLAPTGETMMDQQVDVKVSDGVYNEWLWITRKLFYKVSAGATIFGFNVNQHMSRLGFGGFKNRVVDILQVPELKGKGTARSIEHYQMRYFRTKEEIMQRQDPVMDNLLFCVFLVRRWGIDWKYRRRRPFKVLGVMGDRVI